MKKRLLFVLLCGSLTFSLCAQSSVSLAQLYNRFSREKQVEKVSVGGLLMWIAKPLMKQEMEGVEISRVQVLSLEESPEKVKRQFNDMAVRLKDDQYELLLKANDKEEKVRILARIKDNTIRELIVISMGNEPNLVRIKGKIRPDKVQQLISVEE